MRFFFSRRQDATHAATRDCTICGESWDDGSPPACFNTAVIEKCPGHMIQRRYEKAIQIAEEVILRAAAGSSSNKIFRKREIFSQIYIAVRKTYASLATLFSRERHFVGFYSKNHISIFCNVAPTKIKQS